VYRRSKPGFTLAEVILAIGLVAVVILTVVGLTLAAIRSNTKAAVLGQATQVSDTLLKETIYGVENDLPPGTRASFWAAAGPWIPPKRVTMGGTEYEYNISVNPVGGFATPNRLAKVELHLFWWDSAAQGGEREGYGRLELHVARLVHEVGP